MELLKIHEELINILLEKKGIFRTPYQICKKIEENYPELWKELILEYPGKAGKPQMGANAGVCYSVAIFVAQSLDSLSSKNTNVKKACIDSAHVTFEGFEPGYKGGVSIWMIDV